MSRDTGGPAFPASEYYDRQLVETTPASQGMTLRDYFAAKAMQGLIVDPERADQSREECARLSFLMADAMLAERSKAGV